MCFTDILSSTHNGATQIQVQPTRPSLALTIMPSTLRVTLGALHEHPNYATACRAAREYSEDRCVLSGLPAARVVPRWLFLPQSNPPSVQLAALYPMCEQVASLLAVENGAALEQSEEKRLHQVLAATNKYAHIKCASSGQ